MKRFEYVFQYKIINRIVNCKDKLYKWKISETNLGTVCKEMDGVEHHLFYCLESKKFWSDLKLWMLANLNFGFEFTICEFFFGFPNHSFPDVEI